MKRIFLLLAFTILFLVSVQVEDNIKNSEDKINFYRDLFKLTKKLQN